MAIYHLSAKIVSRATGRSVVAAAAYRSGSRMRDERTGQDHDYRQKSGVVHSEIVAPPQTPDWMLDRASLWNCVERAEHRKDAQLAREVEVSLPRELPVDRHIEMVRDFVQIEFVDKGMLCDFAIHMGRSGDGGEQPHCHILLTTRVLTGEGFGPKNRDWNRTAELEGWRSRWAEHVNYNLEREGHEAHIDHRTLAAQRAEAECEAQRAHEAGDVRKAEQQEKRADALDREADPKLGPNANRLEKLGLASRRGDERRAVEARNVLRRSLHEQARDLAKRISEATRQVAEEVRRRFQELAQQRLQELAQRLETAYQAARERAVALIRPAKPEREIASKAPPDLAASISSATRDALLGRTRPAALDAAIKVSRDVLLGRSSGEGRDKGAADIEAILGRGTPSEPKAEGRSRADDDRDR